MSLSWNTLRDIWNVSQQVGMIFMRGAVAVKEEAESANGSVEFNRILNDISQFTGFPPTLGDTFITDNVTNSFPSIDYGDSNLNAISNILSTEQTNVLPSTTSNVPILRED